MSQEIPDSFPCDGNESLMKIVNLEKHTEAIPEIEEESESSNEED